MATKAKVIKAAPKSASSKSASSNAAVKAAPKKSRTKSALSHDEIARQAYMLWESRGGSDMENWLEAERRLQ